MSVFYEFYSSRGSEGIGSLLVIIHEGRNLPALDVSGTSDPYICLSILPDPLKKTEQRTKTIKSNLNPSWYNECFKFAVLKTQLRFRTLQLKILDEDIIRDDLIGFVSIALQDVELRDLSNPHRLAPVSRW